MPDSDDQMDDLQPEEEISSVSVGRDYRTSEHAGMSGAFQISSVENDDSGADLSDHVDQGLHFQDEDECNRYLKKVFGDGINIEYVDEVSE